ncbi:MAG: substrate-binding domain-containing protein [Sphingomonadaceae bacterium]|nr:substrate-binding domain-containing protein [Sphingomonadaceae bacterium]
MQTIKASVAATICVLALSACGGSGGSGGARDQVRVVGSSTVYPFSTAVAEKLGEGEFKAPIVESTGTGGGMKAFCEGVGFDYPDVSNASRRMKASEHELCRTNGVADVVEIQVGIDGIAFAESVNGPNMKLTPRQIYAALAANPFGKPNAATKWSDIDPSLPGIAIMVYGPPSTSGTRDALEELILEAGCKTDPEMNALKKSNKDEYKATCREIREDGYYVEQGENDNLIVKKVAENPKAMGVFGYSFLEENTDQLKGVPMSGVTPTYESISDFSYPGARPLYIYVKKAHVGKVKGLQEYVTEWTSAWGAQGYLKEKGMVVSPDKIRAKNADVAANMTVLDPAELK